MKKIGLMKEQEVCHICKKTFCLHKNDEDCENKKGQRSLSLHRKS